MPLKIISMLPNTSVHYADDFHCIASSKLTLLAGSCCPVKWENKVKLPTIHKIHDYLAYSKLFVRLMRFGIHSVLPKTHDLTNFVVSAQQKLYLVDLKLKKVNVIFELSHGKRPLRHGISLVGKRLFFGDYWSNPNRQAVNIYCIDLETGQSEVVYQFPQHSVRHIHIVQPDPYGRGLWVSTGDSNKECVMGILYPESRQFEIIGSDGQKWRAVSFAFRHDAVYWGTDNHLGENQIWRLDRVSGTTEPIGRVQGPVYYNANLDNYIVFGTAMEKGEGEQDGYGRLYLLDLASGELAEVWCEKKDRWSARFFGYGMFEFAEGNLTGNRFWVTMKNFEGGLRSVLFQVKDNDNS